MQPQRAFLCGRCMHTHQDRGRQGPRHDLSRAQQKTRQEQLCAAPAHQVLRAVCQSKSWSAECQAAELPCPRLIA